MPLPARVILASLTFVSVAALAGANSVSAQAAPESAPAASRSDAVASRAPARDGARVVIGIKGMYCAACVQTIRAMLRRTPGVQKVEVSLEPGQAIVDYDPRRVAPDSLAAVISALGYSPHIQRLRQR